MRTGINLKQFEKWIDKEISPKGHYFRGKREYCGDCLGCRAWRIYESLKDLLVFCDMLDEWAVDKEKIREHPKKKLLKK